MGGESCHPLSLPVLSPVAAKILFRMWFKGGRPGGLLLWVSVFKLKNEKSLVSYIILPYKTILRGPGRFRVPTPKNINMNVIIHPSGAQKVHLNTVIEKHLIRNSKEMWAGFRKDTEFGSVPPGLTTTGSLHYSSGRKDKRKE